jgi:hypothetical protein
MLAATEGRAQQNIGHLLEEHADQPRQIWETQLPQSVAQAGQVILK